MYRKYVFKHFNVKKDRSALAIDTGRVAKMLRRVYKLEEKTVYHTFPMFELHLTHLSHHLFLIIIIIIISGGLDDRDTGIFPGGPLLV